MTALSSPRLLLFLTFSLLALGITQAHAATLNVPSQYTTIQAAFTAAVSGDTVLLGDGTYTGPGNVDLDFGGKNITVTSQHGAASTIINCGGAYSTDGTGDHRGFYLHSGETSAVISGLTIENGYVTGNGGGTGVGGGIDNTSPGLTVQNCILKNNTAGGFAGGIYTDITSGTTTLTNCIFTGNTAGTNGGGVFNIAQNSTVTMTSCTFTGNRAANGGGVANGAAHVGTVALTGCAFTGNTAAQNGGGVYNQTTVAGTITLTNCVLTGNMSGSNSTGGTVFNFDNAGAIKLTNCTVTANTVGSNGGGLVSFGPSGGSTTTLTNDIFYGDTTNGSIAATEILFAPGPGTPTATYCDIQGGYVGTGNINADPQFVSSTDLHLQPGSPCRGAGTASGAPTTTIDGAPRPNPPSIGAYEAAAQSGTSTTTTLTSSLNPSVSGQQVSLTAVVTGANPTGTVTFTVDGTAQTPITLSSGGAATYSTTALAVGSHTITAAYSGDSNNFASVSAALTQRVNAPTHLLWDNANTASIWNYNPASGTFTQNSFGPYPNWTAKAIADGGTDSQTRVLWDNTDGTASIWSLNNVSGAFGQFAFGPYAGWTAKALSVGTGNTTHVLWTNANGTASIWNYNTTTGAFTQNTFGPYPSVTPTWAAISIADGPDGQTRVLWDKTDGTASIWSLNNTTGSFTQFSFGPFAGWTASSVSVGADGTTHVLWNNTGGQSSIWNYSTANGTYTYQNYGPFGGYRAAAITDGADGKMGVIWNTASGPTSLWSLDNSTGIYGYHNFGPYSGWSAVAISAGN